MDAIGTATSRKTRLRKVLHRVFRQRATLEVSSGASGIPWTDLLGSSVTVGMLVGGLEVGARLIGPHIDPRVTPYEAALNLHWRWMVPVAWVLYLTAASALIRFAASFWPRAAAWLLPRVWLGLGSLSVLLATRGIALGSILLLATGIGIAGGRFWKVNALQLVWIRRRLLPVAIAGEILAIVLVGGGVVTEEWRSKAGLARPRKGAPNVVFIVMDTVRAKSLSLYGYDRLTTPNLSAVAQRGVLFREARSPGNWTLPSHASMFTGRYPHELTVGPDRGLDPAYPTLAEVMHSHGYATAGISANIYYVNRAFGLARGFDHFEDNWDSSRVSAREIIRSSLLGNVLLDGVAQLGLRLWRVKMSRKHAPTVNAQALAWLDARHGSSDERPFFLFLNYMEGHDPYTLPKGVGASYPVNQHELEQKRLKIRDFRRDNMKDATVRFARLNQRPDDPPAIKSLIAEIAAGSRDAYDSCLTYLDQQIGQLMADLETRGLLDSTVVVITSDHGEHLGEHDKFDHGVTLYRELVHVPLVMFGPGVPTRTVVDQPVSNRHLAASICTLAGIADHPFGGSALPLNNQPVTGDVLSEVEHMRHIPPTPFFPSSLGPMWALVGPTHTYIRGGPNTEELYDLADTREAHNLVGDPAAAAPLADARARMRRLLESCQSPGYRAALAVQKELGTK